jgi:VanZ like family
MISNQETRTGAPARRFDWSNRITILAVAGTLFLTQYPFEFSLHGKPHRGISPLMLGYGAKSGAMDIFLNILLFIPFGLGIGSKLRKCKNWKSVLLYSALAGCVFSYLIELSQLYIPQRDSGWEDVFTNTAGAATGGLLFALFGVWLFKRLSDAQVFLEWWLTPARLAIFLVAYFGVWSVASAFLVRETSVLNWNRNSFLVIGSGPGTRRGWAGQLSRLEIWNHALPPGEVEQVLQGKEASAGNPVASFDFETDPPREDKDSRFSIPLVAGRAAGSRGLETEGPFEGSSVEPVDDLIDSVKRTNQFSVRVVLKPGEGPGSNGRIVSLSPPSAYSDLYLAQSNEDLVFRFRSRALSRRHTLVWRMPKALIPGTSNDVLFSYDGSVLRFYANGREIERHRLGPETALASRFRHLRSAELSGYRDIFYTLVFFPAGGLLGIAFTKRRWRWVQLASLMALEGLLAPFVFQWALTESSGGSVSLVNVGFSAGMIALGFLWAMSDRGSEASGAASPD